MMSITIKSLITGIALGFLLAGNAAYAKPDGDQGKSHGNQGGHGKKQGQGKQKGGDERHYRNHYDRSRSNSTINVNINFGDRQRAVVHDYYSARFQRGHCPPGLAKKGNGCMPPGQAKKWRVGYPLPRDVVYHDLPRQVVIDMGPPPSGYKYVRVAADILMIAVGTGMVIDAIEDLSRM